MVREERLLRLHLSFVTRWESTFTRNVGADLDEFAVKLRPTLLKIPTELSCLADSLESWFNKSLALTRCQRYDEAATAMERVIAINPHLAEAYYTRGLINEYRGCIEEAEADYEQALRVDPGYSKAEAQQATLREKFRNPSNDSETIERDQRRGILIGAALLLTPGFLTDVLGFSLLVPVTRSAYRNLLRRWVRRKMQRGEVHVTVATSGSRKNDARNQLEGPG